MREFTFRHAPAIWVNQSDGIVPFASQMLDQLPGFDPRGKPLCRQLLTDVFHTDLPKQTAAIGNMLDAMAAQAGALSWERNTEAQTVTPMETEALIFSQRAAAIATERRPQGSPALVSALRAAYDSSDTLTLNVAQDILVQRGRQGDRYTVAAITNSLPGLPPALAEYLVGLLGEMVTQPALEALLHLAKRLGPYSSLYAVTLDAIKALGRHRPPGQTSEALAALLTPYLDTTQVQQVDPYLLEAAAIAQSRMGTGAGVAQVLRLIDELQEHPPADTGLLDRLAMGLRQVRNSAGVDPLQKRLREDPLLTQRTTVMAGDALAAMGRPKATRALLEWAADGIGEDARQQAANWFGQVRDARSLRLLNAENDQYSFQDPLVKETITRVVARIEQAIEVQCQ